MFDWVGFFSAGFLKAQETLINQNQETQRLIIESQAKNTELLMSLFEKLETLNQKFNGLATAIESEKQEVLTALGNLNSEIAALKESIADLQAKIDAKDADAVRLSEIVDAQIAKVDSSVASIGSIITPSVPTV